MYRYHNVVIIVNPRRTYRVPLGSWDSIKVCSPQGPDNSRPNREQGRDMRPAASLQVGDHASPAKSGTETPNMTDYSILLE